MTMLLTENAFDNFLIAEGIIKGAGTFSIDGHLNTDFYSSDELEILKDDAGSKGRIFSEKLLRWESVRPLCFNLIKGKKAPLYFKFVFYLSGEGIERFLSTQEIDMGPGDINGLSMNIRYDGARLTLTGASSLNIFSLDRSLDRSWDEAIGRFLNSLNISFSRM